jgi:hypothetical protein
MKIIFATHDEADQLAEKYTILELDTLRFDDAVTRTAWCLVAMDDVTLQDMPVIQQFRDLHNRMMSNYKKRNWKYCQDALEHLQGKWKGELDSFYQDMANRVVGYQGHEPDSDWDPVIDREIKNP